jgi:hypothetical protein
VRVTIAGVNYMDIAARSMPCPGGGCPLPWAWRAPAASRPSAPASRTTRRATGSLLGLVEHGHRELVGQVRDDEVAHRRRRGGIVPPTGWGMMLG